ncbi:uncharacterized protein LOC116409473 [Xenopus tropicalis]|uniref:Uncharacterized protein LOC116409473 n=2 Tax=Xenopus tropicalis TaxID=8364 RepID=A0A8J1J7Z9_XENTR|nr:uncharacterized protein LOC116409473 [Xenopus tropicalis]
MAMLALEHLLATWNSQLLLRETPLGYSGLVPDPPFRPEAKVISGFWSQETSSGKLLFRGCCSARKMPFLQLLCYALEDFREENNNFDHLLSCYEHRYRKQFGKLKDLEHFLVWYDDENSLGGGNNVANYLTMIQHLEDLESLAVTYRVLYTMDSWPIMTPEGQVLKDRYRDLVEFHQAITSKLEVLKMKIVEKEEELKEEELKEEELKEEELEEVAGTSEHQGEPPVIEEKVEEPPTAEEGVEEPPTSMEEEVPPEGEVEEPPPLRVEEAAPSTEGGEVAEPPPSREKEETPSAEGEVVEEHPASRVEEAAPSTEGEEVAEPPPSREKETPPAEEHQTLRRRVRKALQRVWKSTRRFVREVCCHRRYVVTAAP